MKSFISNFNFKEFAMFNFYTVVIYLVLFLMFILFVTIDEESIEKDIAKKYQNVQILIEKDFDDSKIILFAAEEKKTGIANYIKFSYVDKYYLQKSYVLDNSKFPDISFDDVFKGKWHGVVISATPERIKLNNTAEYYGVYWNICIAVFLTIIYETFLYLFGKKFKKT